MFAPLRVLSFVLKAFVLLVLFSVLWYFIAPGYAKLLSVVSNSVTPAAVRIDAENTFILIYSGAQLEPAVLRSLPLQAGLLLVLALVIATPGLGIRRVLAYCGMAVVFTFIIHIASVVTMTSTSPGMRPLIVLFASVGIDIFPLAIWAVLCVRHWHHLGMRKPIPTVEHQQIAVDS